MAYIKEYWQKKAQRAGIARKHTKEMQNKYGRCIQTAISATKIYDTDSFNRDFTYHSFLYTTLIVHCFY